MKIRHEQWLFFGDRTLCGVAYDPRVFRRMRRKLARESPRLRKEEPNYFRAACVWAACDRYLGYGGVMSPGQHFDEIFTGTDHQEPPPGFTKAFTSSGDLIS